MAAALAHPRAHEGRCLEVQIVHRRGAESHPRIARGEIYMGLFDLTGNVAVVTGATKGIGRGLVERMCIFS